jgi:hypothetical protein
MNTTPIWVPLLVAALAVIGTVVGTISGVMITQRRADSREKAAWEREMERERSRCPREDAARTFEQRRTAYVDFYQANVQAGQWVYSYVAARVRGDDDVESPRVWASVVEERLRVLEMYATPRVTALAHKAQTAYRRMALEARRPQGDDDDQLQERMGEWDAAASELLAAIREDLGVPNS